jgi:hypothetical protein
MAELAASIVGLVSAGLKITIVLYQVGDELGSAGKEARIVAAEISTFCSVLKTLNTAIAKIEKSTYYGYCKEAVKDMTAASLRMYDEILDATEKLRKLASKASNRMRQRIGWVIFHKSKIQMLRAAINSYKSTLSLMLETINITEKVSRQLAGPITQEIVEEVEQDSATLESLKLAQRLSLVALNETQQLLFDEETGDFGKVSDILEGTNSREDLLPRNSKQVDDYLVRIHTDIHSHRSKYVLKTMTDEKLSRRATKHNRRLAKLFEYDQRHLSQRWSLVVPASRISYDLSLENERVPSVVEPKPVIYKKSSFRTQARFLLCLAQLQSDHFKDILTFLKRRYGISIADMESIEKETIEDSLQTKHIDSAKWFSSLNSRRKDFCLCCLSHSVSVKASFLTLEQSVSWIRSRTTGGDSQWISSKFQEKLGALIINTQKMTPKEQAVFSRALLRTRIQDKTSIPKTQLQLTDQTLSTHNLLSSIIDHETSAAMSQLPLANPLYQFTSPPKTTTLKTPTSAQSLLMDFVESSRGNFVATKDPADIRLLQDIPLWLENINLQKHTAHFHDLGWRELIELDDEALEKRGILASTTRNKLLKVRI